MTRRSALGLLVLPATTMRAGEFWNDKKPSEWSEKDVTKLMTKSPWAKEVTVSGSSMVGRTGMPGGGGGGRGGGRGMGGGGGMGADTGGLGGGGGGGGMATDGGGGGGGGRGMSNAGGGGMEGGGGGGMDLPRATVRWESAAPLREASVATESAYRDKIGELSKDHYIISVTGLRMMMGGGGGQRQSGKQGMPAPDPSRMEEMRKRMIESTSLKMKDKDALHPVRVEMGAGAQGPITMFLFARSSDVSDAKEIEFETSMGPMKVVAKFKPKDMMYNGAVAL